MKSFITALFLLVAFACSSFGADCVPQFQNGDLGDWDLVLNITSIDGSQYPARPVADPPTFSFPTMPSGKPGLAVKGGNYWMTKHEGALHPAHNAYNSYMLSKNLSGAGGTFTISGYCPRTNNGFTSIYFVDEIGKMRQAQGGTLYGTKWMTLNLTIPPGTKKVKVFVSGDAKGTGGPIQFDNVCITP